MKTKSGIGYLDKNQWKCHNVNKRYVLDHYFFLFNVLSVWCSGTTFRVSFSSLQSSQGMRSVILMCSKVKLSSRFVFNNNNNKRAVCAE